MGFIAINHTLDAKVLAMAEMVQRAHFFIMINFET